MLKKTALIAMLLGSSLAPLAWAQDDEGGEDVEMQADDDSAGEDDESASEGDEADPAEFAEEESDDTDPAESADEDGADERFDGDASTDDSTDMADGGGGGDEAPGRDQDEETGVASSDSPDAADLADEPAEDAQSDGAQAESPPANTVTSASTPAPTAPNPPPTVAPPVPPPAPPQPAPASTACTDGSQRTGTVKQWDRTKGFGYITPEGGGADVFVHISEVTRAGFSEIHEHQLLEFETSCSSKGPQARNIQPKSSGKKR